MKHEELLKKLDSLRENKDEFDFTLSLLNITEELDDSQAPEIYHQVLDAANSIQDEILRGRIFLIIYSRLNIRFREQLLYGLIRNIGNKGIRYDLLEEFILDRYYKTLEIVSKNRFGLQKDKDSYFRLLQPVHFPQQNYIKEHLLLPRKIKDEDLRLNIFVHLANYFEAEVEEPEFENWQRNIRLRHLIQDKEYYVSHLRDEIIGQVLFAIGKHENEDTRAQALLEITPRLDDKFKRQMLDIVRRIKDEYIRAKSLLGVAPHLNDELKRQMLDSVHEINDESVRAEVLLDISPNLNNELKQQVLEIIRRIKDEGIRVKTLLNVAALLNDELKGQVIVIAREIEEESIRAATLLGIAPSLNKELKEQIIEAIQTIQSEYTRDEALTRLIQILMQEDLINLAVAAAFEIKGKQLHDLALLQLVKYFRNKGLYERAIKISRAIEDKLDRAESLMKTAYLLKSDEQSFKAFGEALDIALQLRDTGDGQRKKRSNDLIKHIEDELQKRTPLTTVQVENDKYAPNAESNEDTEGIPSKEDFLTNSLEKNKYERILIQELNIKEPSPAEEVFFTMYHPKEGEVETWYTLLVYTHIKKVLQAVKNDASRFKDLIEFPKETNLKASRHLRRGVELTIEPTCNGINFNPGKVSFEWEEDFQRAEFRFKADKSLLDDAAKGEIIIYLGPVIVGVLKFAMLFSNMPSRSIEEESLQIYGKNEIFISYSRKDTDIARLFKNVFDATGFDAFLDVDIIRSGQDWERVLEQRIEQAKIFQIFWSKNYSDSKNCEMEWRYALKQRKSIGYIRPLYWKKPLSPKPPKELSKYNFKYIETPPIETPPYVSVFSLIYESFIELVNFLFIVGLSMLRLNRLGVLALITLLLLFLICLSLYLPILDLKR